MNRKFTKLFLLICLAAILLAACAEQQSTAGQSTETAATKPVAEKETAAEPKPLNEQQVHNLIAKYSGALPAKWGEKIKGTVNHFKTDKKEIALTFDACGGPNGCGVDTELLNFLNSHDIPATLFINRRWIEANKRIFQLLSNNPNFEIENHGFEHRPLCVTPKSVYGISGTGSVEKVVEEIKKNEDLIYKLTGRKPKFFRSGTAYYDDVAVKIAKELGYKIAGFSINSDAGATFSTEQIHASMVQCQPGDIVIGHFNQPTKQTYEGLKKPLVTLKKKGYRFVKLEDVVPW